MPTPGRRYGSEFLKTWEVFEHEVRLLVEAFGYKAETTQPSHDYGVDVIAENRHRKIVIQCKLYGKGRIGGEAILKLVGSREDFEAAEAIIPVWHDSCNKYIETRTGISALNYR